MSRIACLTAGMLGCGGGPGTLFFPSRCGEAAGLEEGVGDHCHQCVSVQPRPRPALEVVEAEFLLDLLMRLFAEIHRALMAPASVLIDVSAGRFER